MKTSNKILLFGLIAIVIILAFSSIALRMGIVRAIPMETLDHACLLHISKHFKTHQISAVIVNRETAQRRTINLNPLFNAVAIKGNFNIFLKQGKTSAITIAGSKDIFPFMHVFTDNHILHINMDNSFSHVFAKPVEIQITSQNPIQSISLGGLNRLHAKNLETETLNLVIGGKVPSCVLTGKTNNVFITAGGSFNINASQLKTNNTEIAMAGEGKILTNTKEKLSVTGLGHGSIFYYGKPKQIKENALGKITISQVKPEEK